MKKILMIAPLLVSSSVALAADRAVTPYFGAAYSHLKADFGSVERAGVDQFLVRLGAEITELFAAEIRLGMGLMEDSVDGAKVKVGQQRAAYAILNLPLNENFTPYLLGGYTYSELKISGSTSAGTHGEDGVSYGAGVNWNFDETTAVNFEVVNLIDVDYSEQVQLSLGFKVRF